MAKTIETISSNNSDWKEITSMHLGLNNLLNLVAFKKTINNNFRTTTDDYESKKQPGTKFYTEGINISIPGWMLDTRTTITKALDNEGIHLRDLLGYYVHTETNQKTTNIDFDNHNILKLNNRQFSLNMMNKSDSHKEIVEIVSKNKEELNSTANDIIKDNVAFFQNYMEKAYNKYVETKGDIDKDTFINSLVTKHRKILYGGEDNIKATLAYFNDNDLNKFIDYQKKAWIISTRGNVVLLSQLLRKTNILIRHHEKRGMELSLV